MLLSRLFKLLSAYFLVTVGLLPSFTARAADGLADSGNAAAVAPGWDWSLPTGIKPVSYSGFITWGPKRLSPLLTVFGAHIKWKDLNPGPGQFNWKPMLDVIEKNRAAGMRTGIHLMGVERGVVPDWVIQQSHAPVVDVPPLKESQPWRLQTIPPWIPGVDKAFHDFLAAFGKTGIAQRDDVVYGYIHGISASRGEELYLRAKDIEMYEKVSGLTPQLFADWLRRRVDAMLTAFEGVEYKLAWMSQDNIGAGAEYKKTMNDLWRYAIAHGTGIRGGGIDFQHHLFTAPDWGSGVDANGYAFVDEANPTIAQHRYRGDENEEYGKSWEWRFGPVEGHTYRNRICWLRCLQMRQNFQMVSQETLALNPDMNEFVVMEQGRTPEDSPDAWAYLRECQVGRDHPQTVRNIERWLIQREVDGSRSVATERVNRFPLSEDPKDINYDLDARRTDRAHGQDGLAFQLDKAFWRKPGPAVVKVTFTDRSSSASSAEGPTRWRLVTTNGKGRTVKSAWVENTDDGQRKTATFRIDDLAAGRRFPGQMDFRVVSEGPGDVTCTMVRVVKANWNPRAEKAQ
jgi:hypothetical protein